MPLSHNFVAEIKSYSYLMLKNELVYAQTKSTTEALTEAQTGYLTIYQTEALIGSQTGSLTESQTEAPTESLTESQTGYLTKSQTGSLTEAQTEALTEALTEAHCFNKTIRSSVTFFTFESSNGLIMGLIINGSIIFLKSNSLTHFSA
jgi:hypothetical protein